jgi:hypothetical protein
MAELTAPVGVAPKKLPRVVEIETWLASLTKPVETTSDDDRTHYSKTVQKAVEAYQELYLSPVLTARQKAEVVCSAYRYVPEEGNEMVQRLCDTLPFVKDQRRADLIDLLVLVAKSREVLTFQRMNVATTLYNHCFIDRCYECYESVALDLRAEIRFRVDASRFLYGSEDSEYQELSQECLVEIIKDHQLTSKYRYEIIAGFCSKTGVASSMNFQKIRVPYDEAFVVLFQTTFFYDLKNGIRERILSAQHLLQMEAIDTPEKIAIGDQLLDVGSSGYVSGAPDTGAEAVAPAKLDENVRADALDVVLRLGVASYQIVKARKAIAELGFSAVDRAKRSGASNVLDRVRTIYTNSQNVHDEVVAEAFSKFIERLVGGETRVRPYHEVKNEVGDVVRKANLVPDDRHSALAALNRVEVDTATFTTYNVTISEILVHVWARVQSYDESTRSFLEKRLVEELVDMGDTCSSGHSGRFVNVLSEVDHSLRISFSDQIKANVSGRISARIRTSPNADQLSSGMIEDADRVDHLAYSNFIGPALMAIRTELFEEFVVARYLRDVEFERCWDEAARPWMEFAEANEAADERKASAST